MEAEEIKLTEAQFAMLIVNSSRDNVLSTRFGPGWVILEKTCGNDWARRLLQG